jgi:hypothetical protein
MHLEEQRNATPDAAMLKFWANALHQPRVNQEKWIKDPDESRRRMLRASDARGDTGSTTMGIVQG